MLVVEVYTDMVPVVPRCGGWWVTGTWWMVVSRFVGLICLICGFLNLMVVCWGFDLDLCVLESDDGILVQ
ncbi:hypothetical protein Hanom_Chr06g00563651 [Helianthus anomalus]